MLSAHYLRRLSLLLAALLVFIGLSHDCFALEVGIDLKPYGNYNYGDRSHEDKVIYEFGGKIGDIIITYQVWDVDYSAGNERVKIFINGNSVGYTPTTGDKQWSNIVRLKLPDKYVKNQGKNYITFDHINNPPKSWHWAVKNVSFLQAESEFGREIKEEFVSPITFAWWANTDHCFKENFKPGYKIYYGKKSGIYDAFVDVGNVTEYEMAGLENGVIYFFVPTAYCTYPDVNNGTKGRIRVKKIR